MSEDNIHDLASLYALDALDVDERRLFEQHYATCEACSEELTDHRETASLLAEITSNSPPSDLKNHILNSLQDDQHSELDSDNVSQLLPIKQQSLVRRSLQLAASFALIAGVFAIGWIARDITEDQKDVTQYLASANTEIATLHGEGKLHLVWSQDKNQVVLIGENIAELKPDQVYELWFMHEDHSATPAGTFHSSNGKVDTTLSVKATSAVGFGVTVESAEGSDQPTSDPIFTVSF